MTSALPRVDFSRIREHEGSQHRAWEELAYLLAWDLDGLQSATSLERRGTPDSGIEFSCVPTEIGGGGRWAWQAKYLFRFDHSTFGQMDRSVRSALQATPDLERYIFVLPKDRSTPGLRHWKSWVDRWEEAARQEGLEVQFTFHGHSDVLAAISKDRHAGAIRYFFDQSFLTDTFFAEQVEREALNLGQRYDPRVNVETEGRRIIDAACRGPRYVAMLTKLIGDVGKQRPYREQSYYQEQVVVDGVDELDRLIDAWTPVALRAVDRLSEPGSDVFERVKFEASKLRHHMSELMRLADDRIGELHDKSRAASAHQGTAASKKGRRPSKAELGLC